ncbi:putative amidoligase domain-containing protein [Aneurinibacillus terranovensis]|uniref:putative amidoligase domain-containing protein n=1 Tax=Aneurinibacillus terranovensis TaxID=278991 RepID=UPI000426D005|nr:hypothetical protein [Aneurinibacillus terranovensis]
MTYLLLHTGQEQTELLARHLGCECATMLPDAIPSFIIQWGNTGLSGLQLNQVVLNGAEAIGLASSPAIRQHLLSQSGVPTGKKNKPVRTIRRYVAIVFQQEVMALFKSSGSSLWQHSRTTENDNYKEIEVNPVIREIRHILQYAVRSIYILGLDFGAVYFGVDIDGRIRVLDVRSAFPLTEKLAAQFASCVKLFAAGYFTKQNGEMMLGADPEFMLRTPGGKLVVASRYFPKKGVVGCDRVWLRGDLSHKHLPLAELRPEPAQEPKELLRNLYYAMLLGNRKVNEPNIEWVAGGLPFSGYPTGGHIHFSGVEVNSQLLRALDTYLALPVFMIEGPGSRQRRPRYGFPGDFRKKSHGGFEYRTLASWLASPVATRGVFALSRLIAHSYRRLTRHLFLNPEVQRAYFTGNKGAMACYVPAIWGELESLEQYAAYADYLDPFKKMVFAREEWDEDSDIRRVWKLPPYDSWMQDHQKKAVCYNVERRKHVQEREIWQNTHR